MCQLSSRKKISETEYLILTGFSKYSSKFLTKIKNFTAIGVKVLRVARPSQVIFDRELLNQNKSPYFEETIPQGFKLIAESFIHSLLNQEIKIKSN